MSDGVSRDEVGGRFWSLAYYWWWNQNEFSTPVFDTDEIVPIWSDETVKKPAKMIAPTGKHFVSSMTSVEKGITNTILCDCNATDHFVPLMAIFKKKKKKHH